jgi:tRNA(Leu) C34 or U34 (ribose-2'-O)-methylase TrmL
MRGYYGIGIASAKTPANVGTLWRSAHAFGAAFIFTIGARYPAAYQPTDTTKASRHVPLYNYVDRTAFLQSVPSGASIVGIEYGSDAVWSPVTLPDFTHPERAVYLLGAEDRGIPSDLQAECESLIYVPTDYCLNVAVTGSMVLYDRLAKSTSSVAVPA